MIKAILLDYDGVMTHEPSTNPVHEKIAAATGVDSERARQAFWKTVWPDFLRGKTSEDEMWKQLETQLTTTMPLTARDVWTHCGDVVALPEMIDFVRKLRTDGYVVGLVSNVVAPLETELRENGAYSYYDFALLSCRVGYAKPDREMFELALSKLPGIEPREVLFVDDRQHCIDGAAKLSIQTLLAQNTQQIMHGIHMKIS